MIGREKIVPSPKLVPLVLSDGERASLEALSRKRTASQSLAERARVVLACAEESGVAPLTRVAERTGVSRETVRKWRVRFLEGRHFTPASSSWLNLVECWFSVLSRKAGPETLVSQLSAGGRADLPEDVPEMPLELSSS